MAKRTLKIEILADERDAVRGLNRTEAAAGKAGDGIVAKLKGSFSGLSGLGSALAGGLLGGGLVAGFTSLSSAVSGVVSEYQDSIKIGRETERVIRTTGGAANVTADHVGNLAERLSEKAGIDDEIIQNGANLLLTFTNVRNEVGKGNDIFDRAVKLGTDMAVSLGVSQKSAAIQLGKALNDPIKGITALSRSGVSFTEQQKAQIKALVESGDVLGAQKIILGELQREFGGAAEAAATPLDKLKVKIGNFQEAVGAFAVEKVMPWITEMWPRVEREFEQGIDKVRQIVEPFIAILTMLWARFGDNIVNFARGAWDAIRNVIEGVFNIIRGIFEVVLAILQGDWSAAWEGIKTVLAGVWQAIIGVIQLAWAQIQLIVTSALEVLGAILSAAWSFITGLISGAWEGIKSVVSGGVDAIVGFVGELPGRVAAFAFQMLAAGASLGGAVIDGIKNGISAAAGFAGDIAEGILGAFKSGWNAVANEINSFIPDEVGFDTPFGFVGVNLPDNPIPRFHSGVRRVPGPPGSEMLAILEAGEEVIPASRAGSRSTAAGPSTLVIPVQIGGRTVTEIVVRELNRPGGPRISQRAIAS